MLTREKLLEKRQVYLDQAEEYQRSIYALQGAVQAIDELIAELDTDKAGEPEPVESEK